MTRRDFELIARVIRTTPNVPRAKLAEAFANEIQQVASGFNRKLFIKACGVQVIMSHEPTIKIK